MNALGRKDEISNAVLPVNVDTTTAFVGKLCVERAAHSAIVLWISVPFNLYSLKLYFVIFQHYDKC